MAGNNNKSKPINIAKGEMVILGSKFGSKPNMPNEENETKELPKEQLLVSKMIMGSLGSLVWGKKSITREDQIKNLLGNNNSIFDIINSIKKTIEPGNGALGKVISNINKNIEGLNLILQNDSKKLDIMDQLLNVSSELHKTAQNLVDASKSTKEYFEGPDFKKHFENKLTIEFTNNPENLNDITNLINELNKFDTQNTDKFISSLNGINKLISILSKNELKVNVNNLKNNIKIISKVLSSNKDRLEAIVTSLADIANDKKFDDNIHYVMGSLNEFFAIIVKLGEIDKKKIKNLERNIKYIKDYITGSLVEIIKEITKSIKDVKEEFSDSIYALNELFERLFDVADFSFKDMILLDFKLAYLADIIERNIVGDKNDKDNISILIALSGINGTTLNSVINKITNLNKLFETLGILINNNDFTLKNVVSFLIKLKLISLASDLINENVELIKSVITKLNNITPDESIKNTLEIIEELLALKGNVFGARSLKKSLKIINASVDLINEICENIKKNIKPNDIKHAKEVIGTFTNLLFKAAGILLIAGLVMKYINPVKLILFAVTLGAFMWAISKVFSSMAKNIEKDIKISKDAIELIAISGAILILGGIAMNLIAPAKLMLFALTLGVFMLLIATSYLIFNKVSNETFKSAKDFGILIAISAGVLILGAVFMMNPILGLAALGFGLLLTGFITLISLAYAWASKELKTSLNSAKGLAILVGISGITLMIGALFMQNGKLAMGAIGFALILGGFIMLVMLAIKIGGKNLKSALPTMIGISILVAVAAMTLLIGGGLFTLFPNLVGNVILFGIVLLGFIFIVTLICKRLSSSKKDVMQGVMLMGGVTIVIALAAIAIGLIVLSALLISKVGWGHVIGTVIALAVIFGGLLALCRIIGDPEIAGFIGIGIAILGALSIVLYLMIGTIAALVAVVKYASTLPDWETLGNTFLKIGAAVYGLVALTPAFLALSAASILMAPGIAATIAISIALAGVAKTLQMWADLRIPEYDSNGKVIGYKSMDSNALTTAADNIKTVLTTLFDAIKKVYDEDKELFNVDLNTFLTGKNPIQRVISSSMKMGKMLSNIAQGVKAWAKLTIPEYGPDGKIVGYKTIDNSAFKDAAENIKEVITCLGQAIIDVYSSAPSGMFVSNEWLGLGNTPFGKVTKALKTMGPMLSSIADGIQMWADLRIPIYGKDKNGHATITGYKRLEEDALKTAQEKISEVVTCLSNGIIKVYEDNSSNGMFDDDSWHGFGDSPFSRVVKSLKTMGGALENIAGAVQSWADLKIPIYGDSKDATKITGYKTIDDKVFKKVAQNISYVVTALATSIAKLANHPQYGKLFRNGNWFNGGSSVAKVLKSIKPLGSALKDIADAIVAWSSMKVPEYGDPKNLTKITKYNQITPAQITAAQKNIVDVVKGLIEGVSKVYEIKINGKPIKKLFDNSGIFGQGDSDIEKVIKIMNPLGKALKDIAGALQSWVDLKIPVYEGDGLEPKRYLNLTATDITTAGDNVKKVLSAILNAVVDTYKGEFGTGEKMKGSEIFKKDSEIIKNVFPPIKDMLNLISGVAKGVSSIVELKIPVYDKNGKIIKYNNIEDGNFDKVGTVINNVLTSVGRALVNVATDPLLNPKDNPAFGTAVEAIKFSTDILSGIADVVANYATGKFIVYKVQKGKLVPEKVININNKDIQANIQKNIITVLTTIGDALALMIGAGSTNKLKYATDKNNAQITRTQNIIVNLMNSIAKVFTTIGASNKSYINNKKALENLTQPSTDPKYKFAFVEDISKTLDLIVKINSELVNHDLFLSYLDTLKENQERLTTGINSTYTVITTFLGKLTKLVNTNRKVGGAQFNNISDIIGKFVTELGNINKEIYKSERLSGTTKEEIKELINDATDIVTLLDNFTKILQTSKSLGTQTFTDLTTGINSIYLTISNIGHENNLYFKAFTSLIENYISTINGIDEINFDEKLSVLEDGILCIYKASISTSNNSTFAAHVETLKKYIETVNSIQLDKINAMTDFVNAMNQLSNKLGNLDNLTNAIANRLTVVLNELVSQLMKADKSINNAHELQEKRKRLINESLCKIENIMGQHMIVEISQVETDENGNPKYPTPPADTEDKSSNNTTSDTAPDAENVKSDYGKPASNPEDETTKKGQTAVPFKTDTSNLLTIDFFKNFMENLNLNRYND